MTPRNSVRILSSSERKALLSYYMPFLDVRKANCEAYPDHVRFSSDHEILRALVALVDDIRLQKAEGRGVAWEFDAQPEETIDEKIRSALIRSKKRKLLSDYLATYTTQTFEDRFRFIPLTRFEQREYVKLEELQDKDDLARGERIQKRTKRKFKRDMR